MSELAIKRQATAITPQIVTLIIDDSGSMQGKKAQMATEAVQDMVIQMQGWSQESSRYRFLLNIAKFGNQVTPLGTACPPMEINLNLLKFTGDSGGTEMPKALRWGAEAIHHALGRARQIPRYNEAKAPFPLCVFFSDGENTSSEPLATAIQTLHSIPFQGGGVQVVACGIELSQNYMSVMQQIASRPDLAININAEQLGEMIAEVGSTIEAGGTAEDLVHRAKQM